MSFNRLAIITLLSSIFAITATPRAMADMLLYDNGGLLLDVGFDNASQFSGPPADPSFQFFAANADDFSLNTPGPTATIERVTTVFSLFGSGSDTTTVPDLFESVRVSVFTNGGDNRPDSNADGNGGFNGSVVADVLVDFANIASSLEITVGANDFFELDIPVNFELPTQTTLWLSIVPVFPGPPQSIWGLADQNNGNPAQFLFPLLGFTDWTTTSGNAQNVAFPEAPAPGTFGDRTFQLFGVPEPATVGLLLGAATLMSARRKRGC